ncbi:predicted protein [Chaetomium globosum CBS 148.51]|uniref:Uncharacterized protein n=1 Tax=Chaetomium globosum (strain ATCC 6205 / CBS 148.51 / DSM 1962 / NBRC 6347 / NRRL 1970) TaxID=306901 RepID=Q2H8C7_CHAGB|nr:uncharacterized protein CHGG_03527 [Chaetomium globosum CBS 148.51]EAQ91592.1 predicted protein [Chaetomium globosum CBS 148.51]
MHPSDGPGQSLDQEMLHDAVLKETCHVERDGMWARSRMEPRFWERVRTSTPWARDLDFQTIRTLALGLTQAAWAHFKNPKFDRKGKRRPCCKLAVASLRFSSDIGTYEDHLNQERPVALVL